MSSVDISCEQSADFEKYFIQTNVYTTVPKIAVL